MCPPVTTGAGMYIVHVCFEIYLAARRSKTNPLALSQYQSSKRWNSLHTSPTNQPTNQPTNIPPTNQSTIVNPKSKLKGHLSCLYKRHLPGMLFNYSLSSVRISPNYLVIFFFLFYEKKAQQCPSGGHEIFKKTFQFAGLHLSSINLPTLGWAVPSPTPHLV